MKNSKFLLIIPAVAIVTLFSIYYTSNAESYASESKGEIYTYSDSTQTHNKGCCEGNGGCGDLKGSSNHDNMMNQDEMMMKHDKQEDDKNAGEHKHNDDTDVKKDDHSGCMVH
jgi:hypothetical protein